MSQTAIAALNFKEQYEAIKNEITFNPNWADGQGYFPNAIRGEHAVVLKPGEMAISMSNNNRKMIFVGTRFGTVVVFERFAGGEQNVYVKNVPHQLAKLNMFASGGKIEEDDMIRLIGSRWNVRPSNIGLLIENIIEAANTTGDDELN